MDFFDLSHAVNRVATAERQYDAAPDEDLPAAERLLDTAEEQLDAVIAKYLAPYGFHGFDFGFDEQDPAETPNYLFFCDSDGEYVEVINLHHEGVDAGLLRIFKDQVKVFEVMTVIELAGCAPVPRLH